MVGRLRSASPAFLAHKRSSIALSKLFTLLLNLLQSGLLLFFKLLLELRLSEGLALYAFVEQSVTHKLAMASSPLHLF